jgi:hypothetical protein
VLSISSFKKRSARKTKDFTIWWSICSPPGRSDPNGVHGVLWSRLGGHYEQPPDKPLTLAAYAAEGFITCYVEPTAVGTKLIDMPLFLTPERYVNVPLERTYLAAYEGLPQRWKRVIEAG